jgi:hypothetical protein
VRFSHCNQRSEHPCVAARSLWLSDLRLSFLLYLQVFTEWAMLRSNQRPLPCEGSTIVCWRCLEIAKYLQMTVF